MKNILLYISLSLLVFACSEEKVPLDELPKNNDTATYNMTDNSDSISIQESDYIDMDTNKVSREIPPSPTNKYNDENEKLADSNIFTDGNSFVVQESSWKIEQRATTQASKLKAIGYKSFVTIKTFSNGETWYRVRIGYFESITEAKKIQAKL